MASVNPSLDNTLDDPTQRSPLVLGDLDYGGVTDSVCKIWEAEKQPKIWYIVLGFCLLYTSPSPRDATLSRMPSSA